MLCCQVLAHPSSFDVAVTTYDMINSKDFGGALKSTITWRYLILDEGHKIKNEETLISKGLTNVQRQHVLLLTGTPLQNNMHELYALLSFLYQDVFTDSTPFDESFDLSRMRVSDAGPAAEMHTYMLRLTCFHVTGI